MPDCFISYSKHDREFAERIAGFLAQNKIEVFIAPFGVSPGARWSDKIINSMRGSRWVFVLASRAALRSPFVSQEIGGAIFCKKVVVPIVWDIDPEELPGWLSAYQAVNVRAMTPEILTGTFRAIAQHIRAKKTETLLIAGGFAAASVALFFALNRNKE